MSWIPEEVHEVETVHLFKVTLGSLEVLEVMMKPFLVQVWRLAAYRYKPILHARPALLALLVNFT